MNSPDLLTPWLAPLGWLALEATLVVLAALAVQPLLRTAAARRSLWRAALLALLAVLALELTGTGSQLPAQLRRAWQTTFPAPVAPSTPSLSAEQLSFTSPPDFPLASTGGERQAQEPIPAPDTLPGRAISPSPHLPDSPSPWPAFLWLGGLAALLARAAWTHAGFAWLRFRHFLPAAEALRDRVQTLAMRLGLRRRVRVLASERLRAPAAFGWVRPGVGVPGDFTDRFGPAQQDVMLAHELAHLAARDPLWQLLADLVTAALWWHPLAWVARRQHRLAGELAADDASQALPDGPVVLAECLIALGHEAADCPRAALGMAGFRSQLGRRVERLVTLPRRDWSAPGPLRLALQTTTALLALAALALLPGCAANRTAGEAPSSLVARWWQAKKSSVGDDVRSLHSNAETSERLITSSPTNTQPVLLQGRVRFNGTPPPEREIPLPPHVLAARTNAPLKTRFHCISPDGGLADVLVYVKEGLTNQTFTAPTNVFVVRADQYEFAPYIGAIQARQTVRWESHLASGLSIHPTPTNHENREFNFTLMANKPLDARFIGPEFFLRVKTDVFPWMFHYLSILPHPFFAVTDAEGRFRFPQPLPPGKYTLAAVHRQTGEVVRELDLTQPAPTGQPPEIEFVLSAKAFASYVVAVGDEVRMEVYQRDNLRTQAKVQPDGTLTLPLIGAVKAAGQNISELRNAIRDAYESAHFRPAHVTVTLVQSSPPLGPPPLLSTPKQASDFAPSKPPTREELLERKARVEAEIKTMEKVYRPAHPKMVGLRKQLESVDEALKQTPPVGDDVRSLTPTQNADGGTRKEEASQRLVTSSPTPLQAAEAEAARRQERKLALDKLLGEAGQFQKIKSWTNAVVRYEEAVGLAKELGGVEPVEKRYRDALAGLTHCRLQLAVGLQENYQFKAAAAEADKILAFDPKSAEAEQFKRFNDRVEAAHKNRPAPQTPPAERAEVLRLVRDGRLHYEMGDLQKARTLLEEAIAKDPANEAAYYYLRLIQESQFERECKVREKTYGDRVVELPPLIQPSIPPKVVQSPPVPNPYARTNSQVPFLTHSSKGAQRINRKLEEIVLPEVHFDAVPLVGVVQRLIEDAKKFDPEPDPKKKGLNFLINDVAPAAPLLDAAGNPVPVARPVLLSEGLIRVTQPLKNLTLRQALDVICKTAELPTQFSVEEYAIAFIPRGPVAYYSRMFRVNPDTFIQGLQGVVGNPVLGVTVGGGNAAGAAGRNQPANTTTTTGPVRATVPATVPATQRTAAEANALVRQFFQSAGVTSLGVTNGSTRVTFNPENGLLLVRGTTNDLRVIEQAIQKVQPPLLTPTNAAPRTALPNPIYKTNNSAPLLTHSSKGAQIINRKLDEIVLPEIHFDSVSLPAVVTWLDGNVKKFDPEKKGLNFLINNVVSDYVSVNDAKAGKPAAPVLDPMGNPIVSPAGKPAKPDLKNALIKVTKPLKDLSLRQVLDVICKTATVKMPDGRTAGLKFTIEEYAIVFSPKLPERAALFARTFKVDPETFIRGLRSVTEPIPVPKSNGASTGGRLPVPAGKTALGGVIGTNTTNELNRMLRDFFFAAGVTNLGETNGPDATQVFFNDRTGLLLVRASLQDLDIIQQAIELLNNKPPQVLIEAKLVLFDQSDNKAVGFDWFTAKAVIDHQLPANPTGVFPLPASPSGTSTVTGSVTNKLSRTNAAPTGTITGILTTPQFAVVMRALEQRDPASVRSLPKLTTPSGKQAVLELPAAAKAEGGFAQGVKLEVLPSVDANGYTISFTIIVTRDGKQVLESRGIVWDAQTLMVGGLELPGAAAKPGAKPPRLVLFLTPTLVDAAGNRIHATTDEMPFAPAASPQPKAAPPGNR